MISRRMNIGTVINHFQSSGTITVRLFLIYLITKPICMSRGEKSKRGSSGRGKSDHRKNLIDSWVAELKEMSVDGDARRSVIAHSKEEIKPSRGEERRFNLVVDSVPYMVKAIAFRFNDELRYRVSFNESHEHVFTWDSSLGQLRAIDDDASTMPDNLEIAISEKLQSKG